MEITIHVFSTGVVGEHCAFFSWQCPEDKILVDVPDDASLVAARGKIHLCRPNGQRWGAARVLQACKQGQPGYRLASCPAGQATFD